MQVHSISEVFDPYTPLGKVMLTIGGSVSTYQVDNLSTEVKKGLREKAERGGWIGLTPFGYRSVHQFDQFVDGRMAVGTMHVVVHGMHGPMAGAHAAGPATAMAVRGRGVAIIGVGGCRGPQTA